MVQHDAALLNEKAARKAATVASIPAAIASIAEVERRVLSKLPEGSPRHLARAPGRLDVMGGLSDYTGALVLGVTTGHQVCVALAQRTDGMVEVQVVDHQRQADPAPLAIPVATLKAADGPPEGIESTPIQRCVLGALFEMCRSGLVPETCTGVTAVVGSLKGEGSRFGHHASLTAATLAAACSHYGTRIEPHQAAELCQRVENIWLEIPVGSADADGSLVGQASALCQVTSDCSGQGRSSRLPDDLILLGLDCGVRADAAVQKYVRIRTASFMGRALIDRIVGHESQGATTWDGKLSRVSVNDYVQRFRDRIPTKMKGKDFLDRFGETGDPLTRIDPDFTYKIRSRTEHHIYENARSHQFSECLSRGARLGADAALIEAGKVMYASHWSYGQRCGLGAVHADALVNLLRGKGPQAGIFGAKNSGRGCGDVITVLMRSNDQSHAALDAALDEFETKDGHRPRILNGSTNGVLIDGAKVIQNSG